MRMYYLKPKPVRPVARVHPVACVGNSPTPKPIFHLHSNMTRDISMHDAEMAIETCMNVPHEDRAECYVAFGVDGPAVEKYFYIVKDMERCYKSREDPMWMCRILRSDTRRLPPPPPSAEPDEL